MSLGSGMPQMGRAFAGWTQKIFLARREQTVTSDGLVCEEDTNFSFQGTIQPLSPKRLMLKPEGQRGWEWLQIHCMTGSVKLDVNDRIVYRNKVYKVMGQNDYSLNGFIEYELVADFQ